MLQAKYFESDANNWFVTTIQEYFEEYKSSPTLEVMKVKMEKIDNDVLKTQIVQHLKDAWKFTEAQDLEYIKDQALDFCKNQEIKRAILQSVELLKSGRFAMLSESMFPSKEEGISSAELKKYYLIRRILINLSVPENHFILGKCDD